MSKNPPKDFLRYRLLTGPDDRKFCEKVSAAIEMGYELYGSPAATFNGQNVIVAQAVIWPDNSSKNKTGSKKLTNKK